MRVSSSTLHLQPGLVPTLKYVFHTAQVILPRARFSSSMSFRGVFCLSPNVKLTTLSSSGARELVSESGAALSVHALLRLRTLLFAGLTEFSRLSSPPFVQNRWVLLGHPLHPVHHSNLRPRTLPRYLKI